MAGPDDIHARELADRYWDEFLVVEPLLATQVGDDRFDHLLPDPSPDGLARRESLHRKALADLTGIDRDALNEDGRRIVDVVETLATNQLSAVTHRFDRFD